MLNSKVIQSYLERVLEKGAFVNILKARPTKVNQSLLPELPIKLCCAPSGLEASSITS